MPIQQYNCPTHGLWPHQQSLQVAVMPERPCPYIGTPAGDSTKVRRTPGTCGQSSSWVPSAPGLIIIK